MCCLFAVGWSLFVCCCYSGVGCYYNGVGCNSGGIVLVVLVVTLLVSAAILKVFYLLCVRCLCFACLL